MSKIHMTFEEFKTYLIAKFGEKGVHFRENGKYGWTSIEPDGTGIKLVPGNKGPHWCDVSSIPAGQKLLGTYYFNTNVGKFF